MSPRRANQTGTKPPRSGPVQEVYDRLRVGLGRKDSKADVAVGQEAAKAKDTKTVSALVSLLQDKKASSSAIKALYECGYLEPALLAPHVEAFIPLLSSKTNRLVWGGMIAVSCLARADPDAVWPHRKVIMNAFDQGSVITQDAAIRALSRVSASAADRKQALSPWLLSALHQGRPKDLVSWLEMMIQGLTPADMRKATTLITGQMDLLSPSAGRKAKRLLGL